MTGRYVVDLPDVDETQVAAVGGKGAHLGGLSRIDGVQRAAGLLRDDGRVPAGLAEAPSIDDQLDRLSRLRPDDREAIGTLSAELRRAIEGIAIPDDVAAAITGALARLGDARGLRRAVQRDGGGPADGVVRGPAGHAT